MSAEPMVERGYVRAWTGQVHYRMATPGQPSSKRPLVCLHLSPGSSRMYETFLAEMARDRVAVAIDTPGFGMSDTPPSPPTIDEYARAMLEVCDALGIDHFDVIGYHTGAKLAVSLGEQWPQRARRLVLVGAPVYTDAELDRNREYFFNLPPLEPDGRHLVAKWEELWQWRGPDRTLEMVQREVAEQLLAGVDAWWGHHAAFGYRHDEHLPDVADRALVLATADDLQEPTARSRPLVPEGHFVERFDWGHGLLDTRTAEVAALVRAHVDAD